MHRIFLILIISFLVYSVNAQEDLYTIEDESSMADTKDADRMFAPGIESILYNPGVQKKQKSGKQIQATGFRETNETHFVIHFLKNALHGEWQSFYTTNQPCDSGRFEKNLPDGEWRTWYANGNLKSVRTYSAKKYHYIKADVKRNHPKDQRYQITRKARAGYNVNPYFRPRFESALLVSEMPILEKIKQNTSASRNYVAPFQHCLHHGAFVNYFESGAVKDSGYYFNGLKHDLWKEGSADGKESAFGYYRHGVREGQWKFYDLKGELIYTATYTNGKKTNVHYFRQKSTKAGAHPLQRQPLLQALTSSAR
jgi:antitoxin component YwqK of YwqJK toxin-antitoxin module